MNKVREARKIIKKGYPTQWRLTFSVTHDWLIFHRCFPAELSGAELRISQLYVRKHTVRCSLQKSISNLQTSPSNHFLFLFFLSSLSSPSPVGSRLRVAQLPLFFQAYVRVQPKCLLCNSWLRHTWHCKYWPFGVIPLSTYWSRPHPDVYDGNWDTLTVHAVQNKHWKHECSLQPVPWRMRH